METSKIGQRIAEKLEDLGFIGTGDDFQVNKHHARDQAAAIANASLAPLVEALREAVKIIKIWHGDEAWDIYRDHAPEMKKICAGLALAGQEPEEPKDL